MLSFKHFSPATRGARRFAGGEDDIRRLVCNLPIAVRRKPFLYGITSARRLGADGMIIAAPSDHHADHHVSDDRGFCRQIKCSLDAADDALCDPLSAPSTALSSTWSIKTPAK
jgi:hypothetical protein